MKKISLLIAAIIAASTFAVSASNGNLVEAKKVVVSTPSLEQSIEAPKEISRRRRRL